MGINNNTGIKMKTLAITLMLFGSFSIFADEILTSCTYKNGRSADSLIEAKLRGDDRTGTFVAQSVFVKHVAAKYGRDVLFNEILNNDPFQPKLFQKATSNENSGYEIRVNRKSLNVEISFFDSYKNKDYLIVCSPLKIRNELK